MVFVMERYDVYVGDCIRFEVEMKVLWFVLICGGCVRVLDFFDLRNELLRDIFVEEDVFFFGE